MTLILRSVKGSRLTTAEMDANLQGLADGSLITGLSSTASPTLGDYLVGVKNTGTGGVARTQHDINEATLLSASFSSVANFNAAVAALTETLGTHGLASGQTTETTGVKILEHQPVTSGFAPYQIHNNSFANTGVGAGTYNHASFLGFNVNRHSSTGTATPNKPALIMGMEDNYYDDGGDAHYGMEWYVEYWSPNGTSIQMRRPFYTRVQSDDNVADNAIIKCEVGTDGVGQFIIKTDSSHTIFQVTASSSATQVNYIKIQSAIAGSGATIGALGETNTPMLLSSNGAGRIDLMTGFFNRVGFRIADAASAVNYGQIVGGATGVGPTLSAQGETNVPFTITTKGNSSLYLATNGGTAQVAVAHVASAVNTVYLSGGATGVASQIGSLGETNAPLVVSSSGSGRIDFLSGFFSQVQFRVTHTASATNFLQVTGSNGGNPTLSASGGRVNIGSALTLGSIGAFAASDKYLIVDSSGNVHVSALGPAS